MTDRPIIFSGPMVQALLAGRKTMTRRLALTTRRLHTESTPSTYRSKFKIIPSPWQLVKPGDRLWVRETWCPANSDNGPVLLTRADTGRRYLVDESYPVDYEKFPAGRNAWSVWATDCEAEEGTRAWRSPIHMPCWASRLTLIVTDTKIERLQEIDDADAQAEGIVEDDGSEPDIWYVPGAAAEGWKIQMAARPAPVFKSLWLALHGAESWAENPQVVALSFRVIKSNIDQVAA